jgi:multidrug efflux pump subunit AcrA (membrane-fusion protein)
MDDFPEESDEQETNEGGKPVVRHVVRDLSAAVKMKKLQAQADERARRAEAKAMAETRKIEAQAELAKIRAEDRRRSQELKAELARLRIGTSAVEKAKTNIAITTPILLALLIGGFVGALALDTIPEEATATASAMLTLLVTGLLANLRSVVTGKVEENGNGNGHDEPATKSPGKKPPARKDPPT